MHLSFFIYLKHATFKLFNIQVAHGSPFCLVVFIPKPLFNRWFVLAYVPLFNHCFQYTILDQSLGIVIIVYCTKLLLCLGKGLSRSHNYDNLICEKNSFLGILSPPIWKFYGIWVPISWFGILNTHLVVWYLNPLG
jgi:hypothetical protein